MIRKNYITAPLPFQGQKRFFIESFKNALIEMNKKKKITLIVDLFGGSGLLSHTAKKTLPECQVIYNDFDSYHLRLRNIPKTNKLIADIRIILKDYPVDKKITNDFKNIIIERIKQEEANEQYIDYITLSSSLLFSGKYANNLEELNKQTFYNTVRKNDYETASDYLDGLDIIKQDYKLLFEWYKEIEGVVFIIDPPYLSTDVSSYSSTHWKLANYLDVLKTIVNTSYIYFTSNKSSLIELLDWFYYNYGFDNPFTGATTINRQNRVTVSGSYIDIMIYKSI